MSFASNTAKIVLSAEDRASPAFKAVQNSFAQTLKSADLLRTAVGGIAAGFSVGAVLNYAKGLAQLGTEVDRLAKLSATSVQDFQAQAYAAERAGISSEKYADILKDVQDKVGDFLQTGGGPLKDFFEQIGPRVGVTAEQFRKLGGSDALQLYVSSLEKANLSQSELTFYMEAIASDSALLLPLLRNNGAEMKRLGDEAERLGLVLDQKAIAEVKRFDEQLRRLESNASGFGRQVALPIIEWVNRMADEFNTGMKYANGFFDAIFTFGGAGSSENAAGKLRQYTEELQKLRQAREELIDREGNLANTSGFDRQIETAQKRVAYFNDLMRGRWNLSGERMGTNDPRVVGTAPINETAGFRPPALPAPKPSKPASRGAAESPFTGLSYDEQIKQSVGNLLGDSDVVRAKEYADKIKFLDELFFSGAIKADLYDSAIQKLTGSSQKAGEASTEFADRLKELLEATESSQIEKQRADMALLAKALEGGAINAEQFGEAATARLGLVAEKIQQAKGFAEEFGLSFNSALEDAILNGAKFSDVLQGLAQDIARIAIRKSITEPLGNALTGWLGSIIPSANGNVFPAGPGISAYSSQVVSKPTIFPFAKGIGLMGEAGAEAIMPLRRGPDGRLGVEANGGTAAQSITININATVGNVASQQDVVAGMQTVRAQILGDLQRSARYGGALAA